MIYADNQNYIYVIAGGETLKLIEKLEADAVAAKQALEKMAEEWGAKISFDPCDSMFSFTGDVPAGWEKMPGRGGDMFMPAWNTQEGQKISSKINWQKSKMSLSTQFSEACAKTCGSSRWNDYKYSFEQIGDKIVVKCPPAFAGGGKYEYPLPPDSTLITFSAYAKMKEDAGLLPQPLVTRPFKDKFDL